MTSNNRQSIEGVLNKSIAINIGDLHLSNLSQEQMRDLLAKLQRELQGDLHRAVAQAIDRQLKGEEYIKASEVERLLADLQRRAESAGAKAILEAVRGADRAAAREFQKASTDWKCIPLALVAKGKEYYKVELLRGDYLEVWCPLESIGRYVFVTAYTPSNQVFLPAKVLTAPESVRTSEGGTHMFIIENYSYEPSTVVFKYRLVNW